jgi:hypothetical protein
MKKSIIYIFSALFIFSFGLLYAQEDMTAEPAYISYLSGNVDVDLTPDNEIEDFEVAELDMELPAGTMIRTGTEALCEIIMPDQSTIKISSGSVFQIDHILYDQESGKKSHKFSLLFGRVRAKVQKFTTKDSDFEIGSGTALAGVRGTVYGVAFDGVDADVLVFEGIVDLKSTTGAFEPISISQGNMSRVLSSGLAEAVREIPPRVAKEWEQELEKFTEDTAPEVEEKAEEITKEVDQKTAKKAAGPGLSFIEEFLKLNAYVGTITIDDNVYARWIFTPEVNISKLGIGLYLPAIFLPDVGIFGFKDWENHDEWDFTDWRDGIHDALIKFYYISWAEPGDPFYFRFGGIDNFFLGHGFIVDNYSNMIYFPEERTVGLQLNLTSDKGGMESMVADFSRLQLLGLRLFARPLGEGIPLAFGATAVSDRPKPGAAVRPAGSTINQLPNIFIFGADAEMPIVNLDQFSLKLYADGAKLAYMYENVPAALSAQVDPWALQFVKGTGVGVGVSGDIIEMIKYRAEYRYIRNYYEPGMINGLWENRRLGYPAELQDLILAQDDPGYEDTNSAGFLIEGSILIIKKIEIGAGYENYKQVVGTTTTPVNKGNIYLGIHQGLIPRVYGTASYDRQANLENTFREPFDENTIVGANVIIELSPIIGLSINYDRTFQYNDKTGNYDPIDSFGITTVFTFF